MNGDHFRPSGFGVGAAVSLAVAISGAMIAAGNNVADVIEDNSDAQRWARINAGMRKVMEINAEQEAIIKKDDEAFAALMAQFYRVTALAHAQAEQLDQLRQAGLIA
jgi:formiminotetrahydrofolate cyclodeaminase